MKNDICIVSVGIDGREPYSQYSKKLKQVVDELGYPNFIWSGCYPPGSPPHDEVNYAFKPYAFEYARQNGYKKILWLDSKCYPVGELNRISNFLETDGYWFVPELYAGSIGEWCKDEVYNYIDIDREKCFSVPQIAGKHFGLNLNFDISLHFFEKYFYFAREYGKEVFHGSWTNYNKEVSNDSRVKGHRHDQIVASILVNQLGMKIRENLEVEWRDSWKFTKTQNEKIEILVDGYNHGRADCNCEQCLTAYREVSEGNRKVSLYYK